MPPKRQYDFDSMMSDILDMGYELLVDNGRLSLWMPTANDEDSELPLPSHPGLELLSACTQHFNKCECYNHRRGHMTDSGGIGSRRLLTYRRLPGMLSEGSLLPRQPKRTGTADELNKFRKKVSLALEVARKTELTVGQVL